MPQWPTTAATIEQAVANSLSRWHRIDIDYIAHRVAPQDVEHAVVNVLRLHEARAALVFCSTRELCVISVI